MANRIKKLEGKVAIVTGASKDIDAGIAKAFAEEGANVVVNYAGDREGAENVWDIQQMLQKLLYSWQVRILNFWLTAASKYPGA